MIGLKIWEKEAVETVFHATVPVFIKATNIAYIFHAKL